MLAMNHISHRAMHICERKKYIDRYVDGREKGRKGRRRKEY